MGQVSFRALAMGARQLVVQEAAEMMLILGGQGLLVDVVDDGLQVVAGGSGDNDLAGAGLDVSLSLSLAGVEAGALQNDVDAQLAPGADRQRPSSRRW